MGCVSQSQKGLTVSRDAAMAKVSELSAQLKDERMKSLELEKQLQSVSVANVQREQVNTWLYTEMSYVLYDAQPLFKRYSGVFL